MSATALHAGSAAPASPSSSRRVAILLALAAAYYAGGKLGLSLASIHPSATAVWPPTGIALAAMLTLGPWAWPAVFAGAFLVNVTTAGSPLTALGIATGNTLEALAGGWMVRRWAHGAQAFDRSGDVLRFAALGALVAPLPSVTLGVGSLWLSGLASAAAAPGIAFTWWLGDAAGALVICPVIVLARENDGIAWRGRTPWVAVIILMALLGTAIAVFGGFLTGDANGPLGFLCMPPLIWAAFRLGRREAAVAVLLLSLIANVATLNGRGPFATPDGPSLPMLEAFMGVLALMTLAIAATVRRRRLAERAAREANDVLEQRIVARTAELAAAYEEVRGQVERRRQSDANLELSEARLLEAQRIAHIGSWEWSLATGALWWSDELLRIYGVAPDRAPRDYEGFLAAVHSEDRDRVDAVVRRAYDGGETFEFEHRILRPGGEERVLYAEGHVVRDDAGQVTLMRGIGQDITERKRAEDERARLEQEQRARREAEEANRRKDEFLAMLSHELRTPLSAITGWCHLLREGRLDEPTTRHAVAIIERNARVQGRLISDILDIARLDSGKLAMRREPVALAGVLHAALDTVRPQATEKNVALRADFGGQRLRVLGDPERLQQVVWNLLVNALKFGAPGGGIDVRLTERDHTIELEVRDEGAGIAPAFLPHLFEAFRQDDTSTTRPHGGLGLGLAIARRIVELHEGTILAANRTDRSGAVFTVTLPAREVTEAVLAAPAAASSRPVLDGLRLLVVDDAPDAREVLATGLECYGARVVTRATVDEALDALEREPFDVLISDVAMPGRDGCDLIRTVRAAKAPHAAIPAIALTAYSGAEDVARVLEAGFQVHMAKPVDTLEIARFAARLAQGAPLWSRT